MTLDEIAHTTTITIDNYQEVIKFYISNNILIWGNIKKIIFPIIENGYLLEYVPHSDYLGCPSGPNNAIFKLLHLNAKEFCSNAYGEIPKSGVFPVCSGDDFERSRKLFTVIKNLFNVCAQKIKPISSFTISEAVSHSFIDTLPKLDSELDIDTPF